MLSRARLLRNPVGLPSVLHSRPSECGGSGCVASAINGDDAGTGGVGCRRSVRCLGGGGAEGCGGVSVNGCILDLDWKRTV